MKVVLKPIASDEVSYEVTLLHQILEALGTPVTEPEVAESRAGTDTREKVRALQAQWNVPVDETMVVNEATALAISDALERRGLTAASRSFTVSGTVRLRNGEIKRRQLLRAFDLDLRAVAVYHEIKSLTELQSNNAFQFLGETISDHRGKYRIQFYDWQYARAERKKADVVVYAFDREEIVGRSRMLDSQDYSEKGLAHDLDVAILQEDSRTEYAALMSELNTLLRESRTTLLEIAKSPRQLIFTAKELDVSVSLIQIAAFAEILAKGAEDIQLSHEMLYGLGRQNVRLSWAALQKKRDEDLHRAITQSSKQRIIREFPENEIAEFLRFLRQASSDHMLQDPQTDEQNKLNALLSVALPDKQQRVSFINAVTNFQGSDFREFWNYYLPQQAEFQDRPELISRLLLTQQLSLLTGKHQSLINELQITRDINSIHQLIEINDEEWLEIIKQTGVPDFIAGRDDEEKIQHYAHVIQGLLNGAFPTLRIAQMVNDNELPIEKLQVSRSISRFIAENQQFDFTNSRIHDFDEQIRAAAGDHFDEVRRELMKIQRVLQVSTSPKVMIGLMQNNLLAAYTIANIPQKSFMKTYGRELGGEQIAFEIHQRASHIAAKSEMNAMHMMDYSHAATPGYAMGPKEYDEAQKVINNVLPNYSDLFGSPDICECGHCRSVYSPAAYFVDLLRFLWRGDPNSDGKTPLDILTSRRPDLIHLPLTCENSNTFIPYIDLANEVMEYYTANDSLTNFKGYDTGEATAEELRANPQNFNLEAYSKLKDVKYPFTLPYHQPLDAIRTYSAHLQVSRYETMKAMNPTPDPVTTRAMEAEALNLSPEEYLILAKEDFDGNPDTTQLHAYFGYTSAGELENLKAVREFLRKTGLDYTQLVELVSTHFINPYQGTLDFLQEIFSYASVAPTVIYTKLEQIEAGTLDPANDPDIASALNQYETASGNSIDTAEFASWVAEHLAEFRQVITLYQPESKCDLDTTTLRTIQSIYENQSTSGISENSWSMMHRFIRLWRKLGWSIHETDLMLAALGEEDITTTTIAKLSSVVQLQKATKWRLNQLAVFWGNIDTYGDNSFYKKLFLNKAVQQIDEAFKPDVWGNFLQKENEVLADHQPAILAAFRMSEEDLNAISAVSELIDGGNPRPIDLQTDILNIQNLSTLYRYVALAKTLKMRIPDLCKLIALFGSKPFSVWDIQLSQFINVSPEATYEFYRLATSTKTAGFKAASLEYIFTGFLPPESTIGLDKRKTLQTAKAIRDTFSAIDQDHPAIPESPLTAEIITAKLSLTFSPEIVSRFVEIVEGTAAFETITNDNLNIVIPEPLLDKYEYIKGSGRLKAAGVMSDAEQSALKAANSNANFQTAVDQIYAAPQAFIAEHFSGVFSNTAEAFAILLNHPDQAPATTLDERWNYVYENFLPVLKSKLRRDAIAQHIASLIGLSQEATAVLIANDIDPLITKLSIPGFSANYFGDSNWNTPVLERVDSDVHFSWGDLSPDPLIPADNFSVRWESYIAPPASGEYTLQVDVNEDDEAFHLYLDDALILEKSMLDPNTSWEVVTPLNAAEMHRLRLEYAETVHNAGVQLLWKTSTSAFEVVPSDAAYPASILDSFVALATVYHRASKFISGFKLSESEISHFLTFSADFANIDFKALIPDHWKRVYDYTRLRKSAVQAQARFTDVFALANRSNPAPTVAELKQMLVLATAWDQSSVDFLTDTHFVLSPADFKNEISLNRVYDVIQIIAKTGILAQTIADWGSPETDFHNLNSTAQAIKNTVKAKYEEEDWLSIAGDLSDKLRANQQQALVAYLLTRPAIQSWGAVDADGLFEYLLIDVQMDPCMDTSRIVQANAAIQMFVNRCLLNMESELSTGEEKGVSPDAIDKDRWKWMQYYRFWEANRKIFVHTESFLEPQWRFNRSEFFKELESYLVQNDITDRSVEQAFRNYLTSLNEVARVEVCGMCEETYPNGQMKYLHVFARTHNSPYKFFYRRWDEFKKWTAWEKIQVDIRAVESWFNSGVHLIPVIWKSRLFLFWPEFIAKQEPDEDTSDKSPQETLEEPISNLEPIPYWEVRLAWSEYVDGKWNAKQVSKDFIKQEHPHWIFDESSIRFATEIDDENKLWIYELVELTDPRDWYIDGWFELADITSEVIANSDGMGHAHENWAQTYKTHFMAVRGKSELQISDDVYLKNEVNHKLLLSPGVENFTPAFTKPFFFSDLYRRYFVRPVNVRVWDKIKNPELYKPFPFEFDEQSHFFGVQTQAHEEFVTDLVGQEFSSKTQMSSKKAVEMQSMGLSFMTQQTMSKNYGAQSAQIEKAFGSFQDVAIGNLGAWEKGLEFHTFHHPFSSQYVTHLNQTGLTRGNQPSAFPPGLMESDTEIASDEGSTFENLYDPNFWHGLVKKPSDFAKRTYYKENVCFDVFGANSIYNWEMFCHAPLYIAIRLSKNGRHSEALKWFHLIFDPMTDVLPGPGESEVSRYWKVLPFKTTPAQSIQEWFENLSPNSNPDVENAIIGEWRKYPYDPHRKASNQPLCYMKYVVMKYAENLIDLGDSLFRQDTRETVYEALQVYVMASHILGPRPQFVPKRGEIKAESYYSLQNKWDDFSNALVELENIFPYSSEVTVSSSSTGTNLLGIGPTLYFCIPQNEKLLEYWDTVADRLYKIRHCQNIEGVERKLALFAPPISPEALIQAAAQGLSLGSILADLSSPPPIYRFSRLMQIANEFCSDVKVLGSTLLAALEKKDAEELSRVRASHETIMLEAITAVKERQVLIARSTKENLLKARETALVRLQHFIDLLGNEAVTVPATPNISATLTADSQLPGDTKIAPLEVNVDVSLAETDECGLKLIPREKEEIDKSLAAKWVTTSAGLAESLGAVFHLFPQLETKASPMGVGAGAWWGGQNLGAGTEALAKAASAIGSFLSQEAAQAARLAAHVRREQEWTFQANLCAREITQLDKQIVSSDIQIQVAKKELENHKNQIEQAKFIEVSLKEKFTNQELYQWMKEQLFAVYKQSYNLAYDMAKKAEKAYKFETGNEKAGFIQYGYWDNSKEGLLSGEKLQLSLRQMEKSYLEESRRELELTKIVSMAIVNPLALVELREKGKCYLSLREEVLDLDFPNHYCRKMKGMRVSIPCLAGPYTTINCSVRLLSNTIRVNTSMNSEGNYEHENDEGLWIDDDRFRTNLVPVTAIATSTSNDSGTFEFNFKDDRYLPFEGAGVISEWEIELSTEKELRQFDYSTITDVIFQIQYTARESGGLFKEKAISHLKDFITNAAELSEQPFMRMFSMKHEFPSEWHKFLHPGVVGGEQVLGFVISKQRFPFFVQQRGVVVMKIDLFAKCTEPGDYHLVLTYTNESEDVITSSQITMPQNNNYGGLNKATINVNDAGLNLEELDVSRKMTLKLKRSTASDFASLVTDPREVDDIFLVVHYKLS